MIRVAGWLWALACASESNLRLQVPELVLSPEALDYGRVVVAYDAAAPLALINTGDAALEVTGAVAEGAPFSVVGEGPWEVAPGERTTLDVLFAPPSYLPYSGVLTLQSNDPERPSVEVGLSGEGVDGPVPQLAVDPLALDFGTVPPGEVGLATARITNAGDGELWVLASALEGSSAFQLSADPAGSTVSPGGDSTVLVVEYRPATADGDSGAVLLTTNDPASPAARVQLLGNGGGDYAFPLAIIEGPTSGGLREEVALSGAASYDPEGRGLVGWIWTLPGRPGGSSAGLATHDDEALLFLDSAGTFEVWLQVVNGDGVSSAPATHRVSAAPSAGLHVELSWDTNYSDVDLHLLADPAAAPFDLPDDCCFCNRAPSWGASGSADDPALALDNRQGLGPEHIDLVAPAEEEYPVLVHYFEDKGGGPTEATVRVWVDGVLQATWSETLRFNDLWQAGSVRFPEGVALDGASTPAESAVRDCGW